MQWAIGGFDTVVLAAYLLGVLALGVWLGRGQRDAKSYLLGGRNLPWQAVLLSIVATETSTVTFLSVPGIAFESDMRFLQIAMGYVVGRLLVVWVLLPLYFRGELFTAYEALETRFGGATKKTASLLFLITRNLADGLRLYLTALVLSHVVGMNMSACILTIGVITIVYTFAGGLKSVVWNDCLQFVVYMVGAAVSLAVLIQLLPGGWSQLQQYGLDHDKFRLFDFSANLSEKYTLWAGLLGGMFLTLGTHGADQLMVQRYLGARNQSDAGRALAISGFLVLGQFALFLLIGVGLACYFDAFPPDRPLKPDEVFSRFMIAALPVGVLGITLAAVFSAAMSTLSSSLSSSASALVNDFYLSGGSAKKSDRRVLLVSRLTTSGFGAVQVGVALIAQRLPLGNIVNYVLAIAGFTTGAILGLFFLAAFTSRVSQKASLAGLAVGLILVSYVALGPATPWYPFSVEVAWPWFALIGSTTTFLAAAAAQQLLFRTDTKDVGNESEHPSA